MTIGKNANIQSDYDYHLHYTDKSFKLKSVQDEKDIGVILDSKLDFDKHINSKINKANSMMAMLRRCFINLNIHNFVPLYKSLVRSHLEYASSVWCPYKTKQIEALESVQRRATKMIPGLKNLTYEERLKKLKLPTLAFRRVRGDMIEVYKITHEIYDKDVTSFMKFRSACTDRNSIRGHTYQLYQPPVKKNIRKYNFSIRVITTWNSLPKDIVEAPTLNSFKNRLDKYWRSQDLLYDYKAELHVKSRRTRDSTTELDIVADS